MQECARAGGWIAFNNVYGSFVRLAVVALFAKLYSATAH